MRPLKLMMQAFGPYLKPVFLDFEKNLRGERIFLIHGATGAGKTTILDAICYALYGRASGNDRDGAMMRSKGVSENVNTEVEFTFALGEKIYTVKRKLSYHPNRKNPVQTDAELLCDKKVLESKSTAVTNMIKDLLGFDADQFRQVVLLPQGEFTNFLKAKADERQPVLDALFNAELYKRVETGLKAKADEAQKISDDLKSKKEALETQLNGAKTDTAALEKLRADYDAAQEKSAALKKISDEAQSALTAGKILAGEFDELERRKKSVLAAEDNLKQAEKLLSAAKIEYDRRKGEESERDKLKTDKERLAEIQKACADLEVKKNALEAAEKNLKIATSELDKFSKNAKKYDERLAVLKKQRDDLAGAEKKFAEAQTLLDKAKERDKLLEEISRLEGELKREQRKWAVAEKNYNTVNLACERLQKLQRDGRAAFLAKDLRDGEACPVCGSRTHPQLAYSSEIIPSDKEISDMQKKVDNLKNIFDAVKISVTQIETTISNKREELKKFSDVPDKATAQEKFNEAEKKNKHLKYCEEHIKKGEQCIEENNANLNKVQDNCNTALAEQAKRLGELQTVQKSVPQAYLDNPKQLDADIAAMEKNLRGLDEAWKLADNKYHEAENKKSSCEGALKTAQEAQEKLSDKLKDKTAPDVNALKNLAEAAQKNLAEAIRTETSLKNNLVTLTKLAAQILDLDKKISEAEKDSRIWQRLSEAANGKVRGNKLSFTRYYLSFMFEQVLTEANYRLEKMSDRRYILQNKYEGNRANSTAGLNLEIFDEYTGESRPVATLSGGESFLASLSLALGLAAVVRNNLGGIKLETIFIDEGFGSLDITTLDDTIATINELSGGRLVGIISHVEELKNQMPVRLEVFKGKTGSFAKFIS